MKRSPLRRRKPLKPRQGLKATGSPGTPRKPSAASVARREARKRRRWERQFHSEEFVLFVKWLECVYCGRTPCEVHHEPTRSAGGTWKDTSPLCWECHPYRHKVGVKTFWGATCLTPEESNARTHRLWLEHSEGLGR
jgi:hypothetical protein